MLFYLSVYNFSSFSHFVVCTVPIQWIGTVQEMDSIHFLRSWIFFYVDRGNRKKKVKRAGNLPTPLLEDMLAELEHTSR
jgi:hypothetical protein